MRKRSLIYLFVITLLSITTLTNVDAEEIRRYVLPNGMVVILKEIHTAQVVAFKAFVKAGSIYEGEYMGSGISHYVEHMLFKGTKKRKVGEIFQEIREAGGEIRGYTSFDRTVYEVTVASPYFDIGLDVLSDAIMNSSFDEEELEKEREVVLKEINMLDDSPEQYLSKRFWQEAFTTHPYRHPIIGYPEVFKQLTREDLLNYFHRMYVPNNIIFVVTGSFDKEKAILKIKETFRDFQRRPLTPFSLPEEPRQLGMKKVVEEFPIEIAHIKMGFHIPGIESPDIYPLDVLAIILGQGRSSRLFREVKERKQLVLSIGAWSYTPRYHGIFGIEATLDEEKLHKAEDAILNEIERLKKGYVTSEELEKAKRMVISELIFRKETIEGQATDLGISELLTGNFNFSETYIRKVKEVKKEDIIRVANRYLNKDNLTIVVLKPKKKDATQEIAPKERELKAKKTGITKVTLDNGMTLLVRENPAVPIVAIKAVFKGGVLFEEEENNGVFNLLSRLLLKGTKNRGKEEIVDEIEKVGGTIDTYSGNNSFGVMVNVLKEDFDIALDILSDVICNPTFPQEEIEKEKSIILSEIKSLEDDIFKSTLKLFRETLWKKHPYRFEKLGNKESISKLNRSILKRFHKNYCVPNNMVLAIFGDVKTKDVIKKVKEKFGDFKRSDLVSIEIPMEPKQKEIKKEVRYKEKKQAVVLLGFHGISVTDPDRCVFEVMTSILSGGGGRLFVNLRDKLGLAYYVGSFSILGLDPGAYIFYIGTIPEEIDIAIAGFLKEIERLKNDYVTLDELERAKRHLIGQHEIDLQRNATFAFNCALEELYGVGYDWVIKYSERINQVTKEDIRKIANRYFDTNAYTLAIVKPKSN